jgi:hypothetical protein
MRLKEDSWIRQVVQVGGALSADWKLPERWVVIYQPASLNATLPVRVVPFAG